MTTGESPGRILHLARQPVSAAAFFYIGSAIVVLALSALGIRGETPTDVLAATYLAGGVIVYAFRRWRYVEWPEVESHGE